MTNRKQSKSRPVAARSHACECHCSYAVPYAFGAAGSPEEIQRFLAQYHSQSCPLRTQWERGLGFGLIDPHAGLYNTALRWHATTCARLARELRAYAHAHREHLEQVQVLIARFEVLAVEGQS